LQYYATSPKVEVSIPDEGIGFFKVKGPPARKADNLTAIYEPVV
jgi:hypothetical protein